MIDNKLSSTAKTRRAVNPSNEEQLAEVPVSTQEDVDRAVAAAKAAFPSWSSLSQDDRAAYLSKFVDAIEENQQSFIQLLGNETGKPLQVAGMELFLLGPQIRETLKFRLTEEKVEDSDEVCPCVTLILVELIGRRVASYSSLPFMVSANLSNALKFEAEHCDTSRSHWCRRRYYTMELSYSAGGRQARLRAAHWKHLHMEALTIQPLYGTQTGRGRRQNISQGRPQCSQRRRRSRTNAHSTPGSREN